MRDAQEYATKDAFAVNGDSYEGKFEMLANEYQNTSSYLSDLADMVESVLNRAYDNKQIELNEVAKYLDKKKELEATQGASV